MSPGASLAKRILADLPARLKDPPYSPIVIDPKGASAQVDCYSSTDSVSLVPARSLSTVRAMRLEK